MTTQSPEDRLAAAFAADLPPARDPAFTLAVMEAVARRRLWLSLFALVPTVLMSGVLLWALTPYLEPITEGFGEGLWPALPALTVAAFLALFSWPLLFPQRD
jgi:hypothetical protein